MKTSGPWQNLVHSRADFVCPIAAVTTLLLHYTDDLPWCRCMVTYSSEINVTAHEERSKRRNYWENKPTPASRLKWRRKWTPLFGIVHKWIYITRVLWWPCKRKTGLEPTKCQIKLRYWLLYVNEGILTAALCTIYVHDRMPTVMEVYHGVASCDCGMCRTMHVFFFIWLMSYYV